MYFDLTDSERAKLTPEELDLLVLRHLADQGVSFPRRFVPEELLPVAAPDMTVWTFKGIAFSNAEDAKTVARLSTHVVDYDYRTGYENVYTRPLNSSESELKQTLAYSPSAWQEARVALQENKARSDRNKKAELAFQDELDAFTSAKSDILSDHQRCLAKLRDCEYIVGEYSNYLGLAEGDEQIACRFLVKRFPDSDIAEAFKFVGAPLPLPLDDEADLSGIPVPPATDEGLDRLAADLGVTQPKAPEEEDPFS